MNASIMIQNIRLVEYPFSWITIFDRIKLYENIKFLNFVKHNILPTNYFILYRSSIISKFIPYLSKSVDLYYFPRVMLLLWNSISPRTIIERLLAT